VEHEEIWDGRAIKPWVEDANVSQFAQRKERKAAFLPGGRNPFISHHSIVHSIAGSIVNIFQSPLRRNKQSSTFGTAQAEVVINSPWCLVGRQ